MTGAVMVKIASLKKKQGCGVNRMQVRSVNMSLTDTSVIN